MALGWYGFISGSLRIHSSTWCHFGVGFAAVGVTVAVVATASSALAGATAASSDDFTPNHFPTSGAQNQIAITNEMPNTAAFFGLAVISRRNRLTRLFLVATGIRPDLVTRRFS